MSEITYKENSKEILDDSPLEKQIKPKSKIIDEVPIFQPKKPRKPKTEAQLKQFENIRLKRLENNNLKKADKKIEASNLLLDNGYVKKEVQKEVEETETDTESDNEIIIVKKKPKKKKKKTIIIEESDSDSDDDAKDEIIAKNAYKKKYERKFTTQQNKNSVIKINQNQNYFVD